MKKNTVTATGATINYHRANVSLSVSQGDVQLYAYVSADDTVTVVAINHSGTAVTLSGTLLVDCEWK